MAIDFSNLDQLNRGQSKAEPTGVYKAPDAHQNEQGAPKLQKEINQTATEREQARQAYMAYQDNIRAAGSLQSEILKGAASGADLCFLLLSAADCISRMTGDGGVFRKSLNRILEERALRTLEPLPLTDRERATAARLERLKAAAERAESPAEARLIQQAIQEHEGELKALKALKECNSE